MVSFSSLDITIIIAFFLVVILVGFFAGRNQGKEASDFLLSGRKVGLLLFVLTNVATWYGGILGVGEFTYNSGLLSWFTQGLPYYIFAALFALFLAGKIRNASLFTIPDKLEQIYGKPVGVISSILIFILVSPAPYILMVGNLVQLIFGISLFWSLIVAAVISSAYLVKGGYKSDLYTDAVQFFIMFIGFIVIVAVSFTNVGDLTFLKNNLPTTHLEFSGGASPVYILVWFIIALWTFGDPGFHQRCYAAKDANTAKYGILISILFWALFDFLTTTTGLFSRAVLPGLDNPVLAFPLYAEKVLGSGLKGIFYAALFATIISTANSFLFLSATTFGRDFVYKFKTEKKEINIPYYTRLGLIVSAIISVLLAFNIQSVISLWYLIGSVCIPGIILLIFGAYFEKLRIDKTYAIIEITGASVVSLTWMFIQKSFASELLLQIEPMLVGLSFALIVHIIGIVLTKRLVSSYKERE